jgi:hypothetical protein
MGGCIVTEQSILRLEMQQPDQAGDVARSTHVRRKVGNEWKIARVLSYNHKAPE